MGIHEVDALFCCCVLFLVTSFVNCQHYPTQFGQNPAVPLKNSFAPERNSPPYFPSEVRYFQPLTSPIVNRHLPPSHEAQFATRLPNRPHNSWTGNPSYPSHDRYPYASTKNRPLQYSPTVNGYPQPSMMGEHKYPRVSAITRREAIIPGPVIGNQSGQFVPNSMQFPAVVQGQNVPHVNGYPTISVVDAKPEIGKTFFDNNSSEFPMVFPDRPLFFASGENPYDGSRMWNKAPSFQMRSSNSRPVGSQTTKNGDDSEGVYVMSQDFHDEDWKLPTAKDIDEYSDPLEVMSALDEITILDDDDEPEVDETKLCCFLTCDGFKT